MDNVAIPERCPLCGSDANMAKKAKLLYEFPVCKKCYYAFASRRQFAYFIDLLLFWGLIFAVGHFLVIIRGSTSIKLPEISYNALSLLLFPVFCIKDGCIDGSSIGKAMMGVKAIDIKTGQPIRFISSFKRNWMLIIPIVPLIIAGQLCKGNRWGDKWGRSKVIWKKYATIKPFTI